MISETGGEGYINDGLDRIAQKREGALNAKFSYVIAKSAAAKTAKGAGEVNGMDAGFTSNSRQRRKMIAGIVDSLQGAIEPFRRVAVDGSGREKTEEFDGNGFGGVGVLLKLTIEA